MIAQSATGTCHGPTIWSRTDVPPTVRSPIVIRNDLLATVGCLSTSTAIADSAMPVTSTGARWVWTRVTSRCMRGGLPSSTSIGMSTGYASAPVACSSKSCSWSSSVATPTTENGQRSRAQIASKRGRSAGAIAST